jgi:hypothetical protein
MQRVTAISFLIMSALAFSCKKEEAAKTKTDLLTTGSWHVVAYTVDPAIDWDGDGTDESNVYPVINACIKDDHTTFFAGGTGELDEGATKCSDSDPQSVSFAWSFDQNELGLTVQGVHYLLETLTETQLVIKEVQVISTTTYTHTVTFSH